MIDNVANGVASATSGTWVPAPLVGAGLALGAVRADDALGSAGRRGSNEAAYAAAHGLHVILPTLTVRAARGRVTRISNGGCCNTRSGSKISATGEEGSDCGNVDASARIRLENHRPSVSRTNRAE